ncbi:MAG: VCBS repeat-containing protein, partial [Candidatus Eremiobacterota bacterium]
AVGDFNCDGLMDLASAGRSSGILQGTGTGSFGAFFDLGLACVGADRSAAVADFNGNGESDLLLVHPDSDRIELILQP